jgi:hypothetical protein
MIDAGDALLVNADKGGINPIGQENDDDDQ